MAFLVEHAGSTEGTDSSAPLSIEPILLGSLAIVIDCSQAPCVIHPDAIWLQALRGAAQRGGSYRPRRFLIERPRHLQTVTSDVRGGFATLERETFCIAIAS